MDIFELLATIGLMILIVGIIIAVIGVMYQ